MDEKKLSFDNYEKVETEKKDLSELPTFFISAAFITVSLLLLPLFTKIKGMDEKNDAYNLIWFFSIVGMILFVIMIVLEILVPLRFYLRYAKRRGDKNGIVRTTIGVCIFTIFVCAFMLFMGFLLVF